MEDLRIQNPPRNTPWGTADEREEIAPGIWAVYTPSHGGMWLSAQRLAEMPGYLKDARSHNTGPWFEEDCEAALVVLAFPDLFPEGAEKRASDSAAHFYTTAWEAHQIAKGLAKQMGRDQAQGLRDMVAGNE